MRPFVAPHQVVIDAPNVAHVLYDNAAAVVVLPRHKSDSVDFRTNRLHGVVAEHLLDHRNARRVVVLRRWDRGHACLALSRRPWEPCACLGTLASLRRGCAAARSADTQTMPHAVCFCDVKPSRFVESGDTSTAAAK